MFSTAVQPEINMHLNDKNFTVTRRIIYSLKSLSNTKLHTHRIQRSNNLHKGWFLSSKHSPPLHSKPDLSSGSSKQTADWPRVAVTEESPLPSARVHKVREPRKKLQIPVIRMEDSLPHREASITLIANANRSNFVPIPSLTRQSKSPAVRRRQLITTKHADVKKPIRRSPSVVPETSAIPAEFKGRRSIFQRSGDTVYFSAF